MSRIHTGLNGAKFKMPNTISTATICSKTGKKATTGCSNTYTEYFLWFTTPGLCTEHSGSELNNLNIKNETTETQNKVHEIVQGISNDIDVEDPQEKEQRNMDTNASDSTSDSIQKPNSNVITNNSNSTNFNTNTLNNNAQQYNNVTNTNNTNTNTTDVENTNYTNNMNQLNNTNNTNISTDFSNNVTTNVIINSKDNTVGNVIH